MIQVYTYRTKTCPCGGSNSNCYRCGGLGSYRAQFLEQVPDDEEKNVRDSVSTSQQSTR